MASYSSMTNFLTRSSKIWAVVLQEERELRKRRRRSKRRRRRTKRGSRRSKRRKISCVAGGSPVYKRKRDIAIGEGRKSESMIF